MDVTAEFSEIASLLGEPARILMLWHLLGGEKRPAGELAFLANVSPQSASAHLARLVDADMLSMTKLGRNRFYTISRPEVAAVVESMAALLPATTRKSQLPAPDFQIARSCYDHLAGKAAIGLIESLQAQNIVSVGSGDEFVLTAEGRRWFEDFGIDIDDLKKQRRHFAKKCLDWSERKYHLAGALGAALLEELLNRKWLAATDGRTLRFTLDGRKNFDTLFGVKV